MDTFVLIAKNEWNLYLASHDVKRCHGHQGVNDAFILTDAMAFINNKYIDH